MQSSAANCGAFALLNALRAIGVQRTSEELEVICGTTATHGTSFAKLLKAVSKFEECKPVKVSERRRDIALLKLRGAIQDGRPVILSWASDGKSGEHWVVAVGMLGRRFLIADGADNELVLSLEVDKVADMWIDDGRFDGVIL